MEPTGTGFIPLEHDLAWYVVWVNINIRDQRIGAGNGHRASGAIEVMLVITAIDSRLVRPVTANGHGVVRLPIPELSSPIQLCACRDIIIEPDEIWLRRGNRRWCRYWSWCWYRRGRWCRSRRWGNCWCWRGSRWGH